MGFVNAKDVKPHISKAGNLVIKIKLKDDEGNVKTEYVALTNELVEVYYLFNKDEIETNEDIEIYKQGGFKGMLDDSLKVDDLKNVLMQTKKDKKLEREKIRESYRGGINFGYMRSNQRTGMSEFALRMNDWARQTRNHMNIIDEANESIANESEEERLERIERQAREQSQSIEEEYYEEFDPPGSEEGGGRR